MYQMMHKTNKQTKIGLRRQPKNSARNEVISLDFVDCAGDNIGEHRDDMKRMKGSVFSISLGQRRTIVFRIWEPIAENTKQRTLIKFDMPHGSMLRMWPECNHYLSHQVHSQ